MLLYFFSIFWWWLLHCSASLVPTKVAMVLKILSILRICLLRKWLLWISINQWYRLFYSRAQCPNFWFGFTTSSPLDLLDFGVSVIDLFDIFLGNLGVSNASWLTKGDWATLCSYSWRSGGSRERSGSGRTGKGWN